MGINERMLKMMQKLIYKKNKLEGMELDLNLEAWSRFIFTKVINRCFGTETRTLVEGVLWIFFDYDFKKIESVLAGILKLSEAKQENDFNNFFHTLKNQSRILCNDIDDDIYLRDIDENYEVGNLKYSKNPILINLGKRTSKSKIEKYLRIRGLEIREARILAGFSIRSGRRTA